MKRPLFLLVAAGILAGCVQEARFHVKGNISGAADTTLFLEHITLADGIVKIDSARLDAQGDFDFCATAPTNPEFYRLRIGRESINLSIDSTETVTVKAELGNMSFGYTVEGSGNCDTIRLLSQKLAALETELHRVAENSSLTIAQRSEKIDTLVSWYKQEVKTRFIQDRYDKASSYFACFQILNSARIFDPIQNKSDLTWLRAIANAWNEKYPESQRSENLANIVAQGRKNQVRPKEIVLDIDDKKVRELGIIDITLPDINGQDRTLSDLRGKVVLLDFTSFALKGSHERTMQLRELYNKYHDRGLEIYQVSLDANRNFWAQKSEYLPWTCVYCEEGTANNVMELYQVHTLPYFFLIDRNCDLQARMENIPDLEKAIEKLL